MKFATLAGLLLFGFPLAGLCIESPSSDTLFRLDHRPQTTGHLDISLNSVGIASASQANNVTDTEQRPSLNISIPDEPDWEGLKQDTKLFMLYQVAMVGVIYFMPESLSQWDDDAKNGNPLKKWDDNVNDLRRDGDDWGINYIGHPYFGATYYVRARNRGFDRQGSFWYSVAMSTIYEYGIEAVFEPVSVQDLVFTPVGGAVIGEYFMIGRQKIINRVTATGEQSAWDTLGLFLTDPIGVINKKVMKTFGREYNAKLELQPIISPAFLQRDSENKNKADAIYGVQAQVTW